MLSFKKFLNNFRLFIKRRRGNGVEYEKEVQRYGRENEDKFFTQLRNALPIQSDIFKNVLICDNDVVKGEIDYLIIFNDKFFAIELKGYVGEIEKSGDELVQYKDCDIKYYKSPTKQLNTNVYLFKKFYGIKSYVQDAVFFNEGQIKEGGEIDENWFFDFDELMKFISERGKSCYIGEREKLKKEIVCQDEILSNGNADKGRIIYNKFLVKNSDGKDVVLKLQNVSYIKIKHKLLTDELHVIDTCGKVSVFTAQNSYLDLKNHKGEEKRYAMSKIDDIIIGKNF